MVALALACDGEQKITVYTQPPSVTIQSPINGSEVDQGVPILMRGVVTDEKFDSDLSALTAQWTANGVPICFVLHARRGENTNTCTLGQPQLFLEFASRAS